MYLITLLPDEIQRTASWLIYAECTQDGQCELKDFLENQPPNFESYVIGVFALFEHVAESGPLDLSDSICHQVAEGIWEFIKGRFRILWFYDEGRVIICSHGYVKQTQKAPKQQIKRVQQCKKNYFTAKKAKQLTIKKGD